MIFIEAQHFRNANRGPGDIERIIVHTAEIQEERDSAEDVARFFANIPANADPDDRVSAHYTVDNNSIVQCVKDADIAFHALGDNDQSLGYELSGFAKQSFAQWRDNYSRDMIELAAKSMAADCKSFGIPARWLTNAQLQNRERGLATHEQVSDIFGKGIRSDPGANFPKDLLIRRIQHNLGELAKIEFLLSDEAGSAALAESASVSASDGEARRNRLQNFLVNHVVLIDKELIEDRDIVIRRRKA